MPNPYAGINTRRTHQSQQASPNQEKNSAGGYTFTLSPDARLRRFLILGSEGGTYYVGERALTQDNAQVVMDLARTTPSMVDTIVEISTSFRAPKAQPALFALAIAASLGSDETRKRALAAVPDVCRTATHLFTFIGYCRQFRGWGRGLRNAVARWYTEQPVDDLAYQAVKYRSREGYTHRDALRVSHPASDDEAHKALYDWMAHGTVSEATPALVGAFLAAQEPGADLSDLIARFPLSWEMLPDEALAKPETWVNLITHGRVPQGALIRQLPRLTRLGLFEPFSPVTLMVTQLLVNERRLAKVHPLAILTALRTYETGRSTRGSSSWMPNQQIVDALDQAFYVSFGTVVPSGKNTLLALDVSGSMGSHMGDSPLTYREATAALGLVTAATEPAYAIYGFSSTFLPLPISPAMRLRDATQVISGLPFSSTDCALPMVWAQRNAVKVESFVVYTDNETWSGDIHPHQALRDYRNASGINATLVVVGMTPTKFSIADPSDAGMLDVVGFDTATPSLISEFARGL